MFAKYAAKRTEYEERHGEKDVHVSSLLHKELLDFHTSDLMKVYVQL